MTNLQDLLDVDQILLRQEELILEATERLAVIMAKEEITKAELAKRLGKTKSFVTQCLSGEANLTLRTIADLFGALGYKVNIEPRLQTQPLVARIVSLEPSDGWCKPKKRGEFSLDVPNLEPADISQAPVLCEAA
jgi:transcriptional regulator with XRE-family HTH domain